MARQRPVRVPCANWGAIRARERNNEVPDSRKGVNPSRCLQVLTTSGGSRRETPNDERRGGKSGFVRSRRIIRLGKRYSGAAGTNARRDRAGSGALIEGARSVEAARKRGTSGILHIPDASCDLGRRSLVSFHTTTADGVAPEAQCESWFAVQTRPR